MKTSIKKCPHKDFSKNFFTPPCARTLPKSTPKARLIKEKYNVDNSIEADTRKEVTITKSISPIN